MDLLEVVLWLVLAGIPLLVLLVLWVMRARTRDRGASFGGWAAALRSGVLFGVLGPPLGGFFVVVPVLVAGLDREPVVFAIFILLMAYVPGFVPALVGGAVMGALRRRLAAAWRVPVAAGVCGLAAALFAGIVLFDGEALRMWPPLLLGALSGGVLEALLLWRARRRGRAAGVAPAAS